MRGQRRISDSIGLVANCFLPFLLVYLVFFRYVGEISGVGSFSKYRNLGEFI